MRGTQLAVAIVWHPAGPLPHPMLCVDVCNVPSSITPCPTRVEPCPPMKLKAKASSGPKSAQCGPVLI